MLVRAVLWNGYWNIAHEIGNLNFSWNIALSFVPAWNKIRKSLHKPAQSHYLGNRGESKSKYNLVHPLTFVV